MKICLRCKNDKPLSDFSKNKKRKDGLHYYCRACIKAYQAANPEIGRRSTKKHRDSNPLSCRASVKKYRENNPEKIQNYSKMYYEVNADAISISVKKYRRDNSEKYRAQCNESHKKRLKEDPIYALAHSVRRKVASYFRRAGAKKKSHTEDILCCSFDEFYTHMILSALRNYGIWLECEKYDIDHIIPLATAKTEEDVIRLNHYTNLQLLYPKHNFDKRAKLDWVIPRGAP